MERGLTLIELVVVIVVIGILSTVMLSVINPLKQIQRGRDAQRIATLKQVASALENYYNNNNAYPSTGGRWYSSDPGDHADAATVPDADGNPNTRDWIPLFAPAYISRLPSDPTGGVGIPSSNCSNWKKAYLYQSDGQNYALLAHCSIEATSWDAKFGFFDPQRPMHAWKVCQGANGCSY